MGCVYDSRQNRVGRKRALSVALSVAPEIEALRVDTDNPVEQVRPTRSHPLRKNDVADPR
jgi:hypothetical protein